MFISDGNNNKTLREVLSVIDARARVAIFDEDDELKETGIAYNFFDGEDAGREVIAIVFKVSEVDFKLSGIGGDK